MAHFVLEYSDNIEPEKLGLQQLFSSLHDKAMQSGLFPLKGIRSRAYQCSGYRIADGNPAHQFVHMSVLIGAGRSEQEKETAAKELFSVLEQHLESCSEERGLALSFEMRELDPVLRFNKNNISDYL